ncbi:MAG: hypothetical protein V5804_12580 [Mucilaginibacter sp.]|uniref:hypothetical protein n=1 Tax=Mucilaginibacter sp. TaxID=1882438 RepID=UPI0034E602F4
MVNACQVGALPREGLQWKAHSEARARTWNGKPDPQGHAQMKKVRKLGRPKVRKLERLEILKIWHP